MDAQQLWELIGAARRQVSDPADGEAVAARAVTLLSVRPRDEILAADQVLWGLMADSYRRLLWAAAYLINGGCSDDGFEYFRGWLIVQGRDRRGTPTSGVHDPIPGTGPRMGLRLRRSSRDDAAIASPGRALPELT